MLQDVTALILRGNNSAQCQFMISKQVSFRSIFRLLIGILVHLAYSYLKLKFGTNKEVLIVAVEMGKMISNQWHYVRFYLIVLLLEF